MILYFHPAQLRNARVASIVPFAAARIKAEVVVVPSSVGQINAADITNKVIDYYTLLKVPKLPEGLSHGAT